MTTTLATAAVVVLGTTGLVAWNSFNANVWHQPSPAVASFYDLKAQTLEGETFAFEDLKGKRVLLVNTASRCGYTRQYAPLKAPCANNGVWDLAPPHKPYRHGRDTCAKCGGPLASPHARDSALPYACTPCDTRPPSPPTL